MQARRWLLVGFGLLACGGRTLDDGVYGAESSGSVSSCSYQGKSYSDGSLIAGACICFCNRGQVECEAGCSSSSGGASSSGASSSGASSSGASSGGASSGGAGGYGNVSNGGSAAAGTGGSVSGGSTGIGGAAGGTSTGGSYACGTPPRATGYPSLIDDMEDGDAFIAGYDGRSGGWFTYNDNTPGYQFPSPGMFAMEPVAFDASGGRSVANTYGKGFSAWGAGMGLVLNSGCPYDASIYHGLHFFARAEVMAGTGLLYVLLPTAATTPPIYGGTCVQSAPTSCYDDYQTTIPLSSAWLEEYVSFDSLRQLGWGTPVKFDARTLMGVNFQTLYGQGATFSFSIDSISFY